MKSVASSYGSIGFNMVYLNKDTGSYIAGYHQNRRSVLQRGLAPGEQD